MEDSYNRMYPVAYYNNYTLPSKFEDINSKTSLDCKYNNLYEDKRCIEDYCDKFINIKADQFIPLCCGVYYFEIKILMENLLGHIGLGFSWESISHEKKLGYNNSSLGLYIINRQNIALHHNGEDRSISVEAMKVQTIGIGINFLDGSVFCTVNGISLLTLNELSCKDAILDRDVYPVISSQCPNAKFIVNLGVDSSQPFSYDFEYFKMTHLRQKRNQCLSQQYSPKLAFVAVQNLVSDYLLHHGYAEAWEHLHKYDDSVTKGQSIEKIRNRRLIQTHIIEEDYSEAIDAIKIHFPDFFQQYPIYKFILKCRHFINLIVKRPSFQMKKEKWTSGDNLVDVDGGKVKKEGTEDLDCVEKMDGLVEDDMKCAKSIRLDPDLCTRYHNGTSEHTNGVNKVKMDTEEADEEKSIHESPQTREGEEMSQERVMMIINYGKTLKEEATAYYMASKDSNPDHKQGIDLLQTAFSLIAYRDPYSSPFSDILKVSERESLAHKINGTINGMLGRTTKAQLDCLLESIVTNTSPVTHSSWKQRPSNDSWTPVLAAIHPKLLISELSIEKPDSI